MPTHSELSAKALAAWKREFGMSQIQVPENAPELFKQGEYLGGGGNGIVHKTELDGVPLALKSTFTKKLDGHHLNEIQILAQLSGIQHEHIVSLIGSTIRKQGREYKIDVLTFPVAECALDQFMQDVDHLMSWTKQAPGTVQRNLVEWAVEGLIIFYNGPSRRSFNVDAPRDMEELIRSSQQRILQSFACIAQAVAHLHHHRIRHKDLKPSQVLISPDGLWLTDFGYSIDTSGLPNSLTSNGHTMTFKYQAPERVNRRPCGRAEDIFALGCTFLDMAMRLTPSGAEVRKSWKFTDQKWSFQANLKDLERWLAPMSDRESLVPAHFAPLLRKMMAYRPEDRPSIDQVVEALSSTPCRCASRR